MSLSVSENFSESREEVQLALGLLPGGIEPQNPFVSELQNGTNPFSNPGQNPFALPPRTFGNDTKLVTPTGTEVNKQPAADKGVGATTRPSTEGGTITRPATEGGSRNIGAPSSETAKPHDLVYRPGQDRPPVADKINWFQDDVYGAYSKAYSERKPLVIMFEADWCSYCKRMDKEVLSSKEFRKFAEEAVFLRLNVEKDDKHGNVKQLMNRLGITEFPALAVVDVASQNINVLGRIVGYHNPPQFMNVFRQVLPKDIADRHPPDDDSLLWIAPKVADKRLQWI